MTPSRPSAAQVEDDRGDCVPLTLYNALAPDVSLREAQAHFPKGTRLAVKEPYLKLSNAGTLTVRVDDPHNLVVVHKPGDGDDELFDPEALKARGNDHYRRRRYGRAADCYGAALELDAARRARARGAVAARAARGGVPVDVDADDAALELALLANRAACRVALGRYRAAADDCDAALRLRPGHEKATYRKALALTGALRHGAALALLRGLALRAPGRYAARVAEVEARARNDGGAFDLGAVAAAVVAAEASAAAAGLAPERAVADATAPVAPFLKGVDVAARRGRRGAFAARDFRAGDVVLVERAVAFSRPRDAGAGGLVHDPATGETHGAAVDDVAASLAYALPGRPLVAARLAALANEREVPRDELLRYDDAEVREGEARGDPGLDELRALVRRHALALRLADDAPGDDVRARAFQGAALFVVAAFLNADDDATTVPTVLGDLLVLHATRDVRRGDELTRATADPDFGRNDDCTWVCAT